MNTGRLQMLAGLSVVELGDSTAGSAAAALLADLGAEVVKYRPTLARADGAGPRLRLDDGGYVSALSQILDRRKRIDASEAAVSLRDDKLRDACRSADIVICDLVERACAPVIGDLGEYQREVATLARRAWVTISPFGLEGPHAAYRGSELISAAAGGGLAGVRSLVDGQPIKLAGMQSLMSAGQLACLAALQAFDLARRDGRAVHMDVSAQEAVMTISARLELSVALLRSSSSGGSGRTGPPSGLYRCRDGQIHIQVLENHQWRGVVTAMNFAAWADGSETPDTRKANAKHIETCVQEWTGGQGMVECADILQRHGVPAVPLNTPADLLRSPQLRHRQFFEEVELAGCRRRVATLPVCVDDLHADGAAVEPRPRTRSDGIRGLKLLELGHVIAVPFAASLLGAMGADVVRVEDLRRLDIYRRSAPFAEDKAGPNRGCYFTVNNHNKRSVTLDEVTSADRLAPLVAEADIVLENWGSRAKRAGLDALSLVRNRPDLLALSCSGFGADGPMGEYRAYAYSVHAFGGLLDVSRDTRSEIVNLRSAWADFCTGTMLAVIMAAWAAAPNRPKGAAIDLSMAEVVAARLGDYIAAVASHEEGSACLANDMPHAAPNNVYRTDRGKQWLAISVSDDSEWRALAAALGDPAGLSDPVWTRSSGREAARAAIDKALQDLLIDRDGSELFHMLQRAGVPASPVYDAERMIDDAHLREREFFSHAMHPEIGSYRMPGLPWRQIGHGRAAIIPAPVLSEAQNGGAELSRTWKSP